MSNEQVKNIVIGKLLDAMAQGTCPWRKPWSSTSIRPCYINGRSYHGLNWFILSLMPYAIPVYMTYKEAVKRGGNVKKGEKGTPVIFWKMLKKEKDGKVENIPMLRYYTVFNISQVEGVDLPKRFIPKPGNTFNPIAKAEEILAGFESKPEISYGGDRACYFPALDKINCPNSGDFASVPEFYSTLFHELGHSTGHTSRLNRKEVMDNKLFASHDYSLEELVAEMTSALLCAEAGIDQPVLENQAAYLRSWHNKLSNDPSMLITAASRAQKAADLIIGKVEDQTSEEDEVA